MFRNSNARTITNHAVTRRLFLVGTCGTLASRLVAQTPPAETDGTAGVQLGTAQTKQLQVGLRIQAKGACRGIIAAVPIPKDWPEQQVTVTNEEFSPAVKNVKYQELGEGVKRMVVQIPRLNAGETAEAVLTLSLSRNPIQGPESTEQYQIPKRLSRDVRIYMGNSPFIESNHARIRSIARQITREATSDWDKVRAIYDYVRDNVQYVESELKGAVRTLHEGEGDCEAMTSLFIALCRANRIPARMVWVTNHSYPEFYLVDAEDKGHWFPCQISGAEAFGSMPEVRPILQKGDNYKIPETRERRRYVALQLKAAQVRGGAPTITEILQEVN